MTTTTIDLDRQRAEFEAAVREMDAGEHALDRDEVFGRDYVDEQIDHYWTGFKMARRSNAGEAAGIKTWQERESQYETPEFSQIERMQAEIADLRAALATQQAARAQQGPVRDVFAGLKRFGMHMTGDGNFFGVMADGPYVNLEDARAALATPVSAQAAREGESELDAKDAVLADARAWIVKNRPAITLSRQVTVDAYLYLLKRIDAAMQKGPSNAQ